MKTTTFIPNEDRLLVIPDPVEDKSEGGILLPESAQEQKFTGTVFAAGEGYIENGAFVMNRYKVGDRILYGRYSANEITVDGQTYFMMRGRDIYGAFIEVEQDA